MLRYNRLGHCRYSVMRDFESLYFTKLSLSCCESGHIVMRYYDVLCRNESANSYIPKYQETNMDRRSFIKTAVAMPALPLLATPRLSSGTTPSKRFTAGILEIPETLKEEFVSFD